REALALSSTDLERSIAHDALAETFLAGYDGDPAWVNWRKAAEARRRATPEDGEAIAYYLARACEMPTRWPGSMRATPTEAEVRADLDLGFSLLPDGDSEARVRLMAAQSFWAFAFRERAFTDEEVGGLSRSALEAADMARRLGRIDLESAALDAATGRGVTTGLYSLVADVSERRIKLITQLNDVGEIGDIYATSSWLRYELGEYEEALRLGDLGVDAMEEQAVNFQLHCLAWRAAARYRLGDWDGTIADVERTRLLLGERADAPPYFASPPYAFTALIALARGDDAESDRLLEMLLPLERTESGTF